MKATRLTYTIAILLAILLVAANSQPTFAAPARQSSPTTWTVLAGGEAEMEQTENGMMGAWDLMHFYPGTITIDAGDTIDWKLNSTEFHNVTFLAAGEKFPSFVIPEGGSSQRFLFNPLVAVPQGGSTYDGSATTGSGLLGGGPQNPTDYKLTFTKPGAYNYFCAIHSAALPNGQIVGMLGKVIVQDAGAAYPQTQAQIDDAVKAQMDSDSKAVMAADATARKPIPDQPGPNGSTVHTISIGYDTPDGLGSLMRFSPANITIHAGDTVVWKQTSAMTPHTVSIFSGAKEPDLALVEPQPAGPPRLVFNPAIILPAGGQVYSGKGVFNSGLLNATMDPAPGPRSYSLKFDTPGTYEYICSLHDQMGMSGHITVLAATSAMPMMPTTGSGFDFSLLIVLATALIVLGLMLRKRVVLARR